MEESSLVSSKRIFYDQRLAEINDRLLRTEKAAEMRSIMNKKLLERCQSFEKLWEISEIGYNEFKREMNLLQLSIEGKLHKLATKLDSIYDIVVPSSQSYQFIKVNHDSERANETNSTNPPADELSDMHLLQPSTQQQLIQPTIVSESEPISNTIVTSIVSEPPIEPTVQLLTPITMQPIIQPTIHYNIQTIIIKHCINLHLKLFSEFAPSTDNNINLPIDNAFNKSLFNLQSLTHPCSYTAVFNSLINLRDTISIWLYYKYHPPPLIQCYVITYINYNNIHHALTYQSYSISSRIMQNVPSVTN
jgi:hypothetical protein